MDVEPEQPPEPNIPRDIYLTEEQLTIQALVDQMDIRAMPWIFERTEDHDPI